MESTGRFRYVYIILALLAALFVWNQLGGGSTSTSIPYSAFEVQLEEGKIARVVVQGDQLEGSYKEPVDGHDRFVTQRVDDALAERLRAHEVEYSRRADSGLMPALLWLALPALFFFGLWFFLLRRMAGGGARDGGLMAIGKSKAKIFVETDTRVTFADVAGVDEAKLELAEIVEFLKHPQKTARLGARMPKGVLLVGPPGTGKTLLARAVAGEASVPFFSISGSEFVEMFVGVGAARVRDLFEQARKSAPAIIFIDELDALGRARSAFGGTGGSDEKEQTLNQLLVELDGFDASSGIVLIAATNRPEILDPALLRAGRFDRQVLVDRPDKAGRVQILEVHLRKVQLDEDVDAGRIAALTPGFTGADLANLVNEAALLATRRDALSVGMNDFNEGIERIIAGLEKKNRLLNAFEREVVAHHEMGHAVVSAALALGHAVHKISIIPRGIGALGYTIQRPLDDRYLMTRDELEAKMAVLLGGRASEDAFFHHLSTGAADDLDKSTNIARNMVTRYGMAPALGHVTYDSEPASFLGQTAPGLSQRTYSEATAREIDCAIRDLVHEAWEQAHAVVTTNLDVIKAGAERLLEQETLDGDELAALLATVRKPAPADLT